VKPPPCVAVASAALAVLLATAAGAATPPRVERLAGLDTRLCPFPLRVIVSTTVRRTHERGRTVTVRGPTTVTLRNAASGRTAVLRAAGKSARDPVAGDLRFVDRQLWLGGARHVPYLSTDGDGAVLASTLLATGARVRRVVDPCVLVASVAPAVLPRATPAPWGVPTFALTHMDAARLSPLIGRPTRHDHMHLDVIVNGEPVTVPAGIGQAEPVDRGPGPCPPPPDSRSIGDCAPGHYFTAEVAASQLQTHSSSGILHLQTERPGDPTLGQFFDEWGVRFDGRCLGAHGAGGGKELRVYVDGSRPRGNPRRLVLRDGQEIAVVYGSRGAFRNVPSRYEKRMPAGCGGPGEPTCFPG